MKFHQLFKAAIYEPKKLAAFRLLPIGKVFRYVFLFVALFTLISFVRFIASDAVLFESSPELMEHGEKIGWIIYPTSIFTAASHQHFLHIRQNHRFCIRRTTTVEGDEKTRRIPSYVENIGDCCDSSHFANHHMGFRPVLGPI